MLELAWLLPIAFGVGALIGAVGIGGFLVVPVLVFVQGRPLREAVIAAVVAFVGAGLVSLVVVPRQPHDVHRSLRSFLVACVPGALAGALLLRVVDVRVIGLLITAAVGLAGLAQLFGWPRMDANSNDRRTGERGPVATAIEGVVTGLASTLTGTSGPLVAMPLLALSGMPIRERIRAGQVAQLPIALTASVVLLSAGAIGWRVAITSAIAVAIGVLAGMRVTPRVAPDILSRTAALLMLATAAAMLVSTLR
jgi:uncharacterized membrane protein YfcA